MTLDVHETALLRTCGNYLFDPATDNYTDRAGVPLSRVVQDALDRLVSAGLITDVAGRHGEAPFALTRATEVTW